MLQPDSATIRREETTGLEIRHATVGRGAAVIRGDPAAY